MSSYTIPTDWTTDDWIEALLPPIEAIDELFSVEIDRGVSVSTLEWMARVEAIRQSQQAKLAQPELLHVAERKAY